MWVRSEYAGELAVLSTWLCGLLPWAITYGRADVLAQSSSVWIFWFLPRRFLFLPSIEFGGGSGVPAWAWQFTSTELYGGETYAGLFWLAGTLVFLAAFLFSILYYAREDRVEAMQFDPVRVLGTLLILSGALLSVSFLGLWQSHPGFTLPVGIVFQFVLGAVLVKTERVERS